MASWQSRLTSAYMRLVIRRRDWGDERAMARRARLHFGAPRLYGGLVLRGLAHRRVVIGGVARGEWIEPAANASRTRGVLMYVHGGGYVACSSATHRPVTASLARLTGMRVLAADYRLAPESRFPAALDDVITLYQWLVTEGAPGEPVSLAGESAGGGLVLALAQHARDAGLPRPACVAALSPWADLSGSGASVRANEGRCAMFRHENIPAFAMAYLGHAHAFDPRASPLMGDWSGLPPVLLQVGSGELLLDDARRVHERITRSGGASTLQVYDDAPHGWHLLAPWMPEANVALRAVAAFVAEHGTGGMAANANAS